MCNDNLNNINHPYSSNSINYLCNFTTAAPIDSIISTRSYNPSINYYNNCDFKYIMKNVYYRDANLWCLWGQVRTSMYNSYKTLIW